MSRPKRFCEHPDCSKPRYGRGYCVVHYNRLKRHGDPDYVGGTPKGAAEEFLERVACNYSGLECLIWPFHRHQFGQAMFGSKKHGSAIVSRVVCEKVHGPPPTPSHEAAHSCGNGDQGCVSPVHLSWKTRKENEADKLIHDTRLFGERHALAKLNEKEVLEILQLKGKIPQTKIGEMFNVSQACISVIMTGKRWSHLR